MKNVYCVIQILLALQHNYPACLKIAHGEVDEALKYSTMRNTSYGLYSF